MADNKAEAAKWKATGNERFKAGDLNGSIEAFGKAIELDPTDAVFYSNRSMVAHKAGRLEEALKDGDKCVELRPEWAKGYSRKGAALFSLGRLEDAATVYEEGLKAAPGDAGLQSSLEQAMQALMRQQQQGNPLAAMFGPDMWTKLALNPATRELVQEPEVAQKLRAIQANPNLLGQYLQDEKVGQCLQVLLGVPDDMPPAEDVPAAAAAPKPAAPKPAAPKKEPEPELAPEVKEALQHKEEGNKHYKARRFDEALACYQKAFETSPQAVFCNNIAAVHVSQKAWEEATKWCDKAIELAPKGDNVGAVLSRAYGRKATVLHKQGQLDEAIDLCQKALLEKKDRKVSLLVQQIKREKEEAVKRAFLSPEKSEEAKQLGAEAFKAGDFPKAVACFEEAVKRDPQNFKAKNNLAFAMTKLGRFDEALRLLSEIIGEKPEFCKPYLRRALLERTVMKRHDKAIETLEAALEACPAENHPEIRQAQMDVQRALNSLDDAGHKARGEAALKDPAIQALLKDEEVSVALSRMQSGDQTAAAKAMADPQVAAKIRKLMAAGVLRTG